MSLDLIRRLVKGAPLTAADHDGNLDKLEVAIQANIPPQALRPTSTPTFAGLTVSGLPADRLVFTGPGGALTPVSLGANLSIVNGALVAAGGGGGGGSGTVTSVGLSMPTGFSVAGDPVISSGTLAVSFATGYSLPAIAKQTTWDAAYAERRQWDGGSAGLDAAVGRASLELGSAAQASSSAFASAVQGAKADTAVQPGALAGYVQNSDARLTDAREWSAETISQAEAEAGTATARRALTAQRMFQAIAAWWSASAAKGKLDGIASNATANATDAQLRDRSTHTGTQPASTISDFTATARGAVSASGSLTYNPATGIFSYTAPAGTSSTTIPTEPLAYAADIELNLATLTGKHLLLTLTGPVSFTTINRVAGYWTTIFLEAGAAQRALTFPAAWAFMGIKPATLAANKSAVLTIKANGVNVSDIRAVWSAQQ